ncbi:MAG: GNAT family N-acetyltransferase [Eubacteriales bacterium]
MSDKNIYFGRGNAEMFDDYIDFINYVFGFNGTADDFKKLLPKLYKYEYEPAASSYVALENGKLKAAIGAFDHDISVCGTRLKTRGIGNVAVHPYTRGSGYMKKLMNMALDDMVADGVVLSVLGGRRQRYNYFSYDKLGECVSMSFNDDNMRHTFGKSRAHSIKFVLVGANDVSTLDSIYELSRAHIFHALREREKLFEILCSWEQKIYVGFENGEFLGYAVAKGREVNEMLLTDESKIADFVCALYDHIGGNSLSIKLPIFLPNYIDSLYRICEYYSIGPCKSFSVLNYRAVIDAFLKLKATYAYMPDGDFTIDVDGRGGRERIKISVLDGNISVDYSEEEPDIALSHLDAMNLLFATVCPAREKLPVFVKLWLPLPIYLYSSDAV